jgi:hypothetical protein
VGHGSGDPGKLGASPAPGALQGNAAAAAGEVRHQGVQVGGVAEEIIVIPDLGLRFRVAGGPLRTADGAGQLVSLQVFDADVHPVRFLGEGDRDDLPGRGKSQSRGKYCQLLHKYLPFPISANEIFDASVEMGTLSKPTLMK